jgi:hypothetical protein
VNNFLVASLLAAAAFPLHAADPATIDWGAIASSKVTLFYPGQSSHEWLQADHNSKKGAAATVRGEACFKCHENRERTMGEGIVKGGVLEPSPVKGKNGWVEVDVKAAYDERNAYLRFQWKTLNPYPGTEHPYLRYDGKDWKPYGFPKLDKVVQDGKEAALYEDRLAIMIDDGKVPDFHRQGCWLTCHDGQRDMAKQFTRDELAANPLFIAIKKTEVRKYLPSTRTHPSDWRSGKSVEEIARIRAEGGFLDLIQWRAHRSNPVGMADDGNVLEYRLSDAGKDMFARNADAKTHAPKYMWEATKVGYRSITEGDLRKADHFLVLDSNAVPFDASAGWKAGDMIPDYVTSRKEAKGSAADNTAVGSWKDGAWTVVIVRPLGLANDDDKALREGQVYNIGISVHDDNITTRGHFVSLPLRLGIGRDAGINAVKLP